VWGHLFVEAKLTALIKLALAKPEYLKFVKMIVRHYARWMRKPERVGRLAEQLASKFPPTLPERRRIWCAGRARRDPRIITNR
jgi:hypothetical protein